MAQATQNTPQSAPPNFYSQVGAMAAGQGGKPAGAAGGAGGGGAAQSGPAQGGAAGQPSPADQFLEMSNKLKKVLQQMKEINPNGQDISKYMDAMDSTLTDCITHVYGGGDQTQTPGTDSATTLANPGGGAQQSAPLAGGQPGVNAGAPAQ